MRFNRTMYCAALVVSVIAGPSLGAEMKADAINVAKPSTKSLSNDKPTPAGVRLQGVVGSSAFRAGRDRRQVRRKREKGATSLRRGAAAAYFRCRKCGRLGKAGCDGCPVTRNYTIADRDVAGPFLEKLPATMEDMKGIPLRKRPGLIGPAGLMGGKCRILAAGARFNDDVPSM